MYEHLYEVTEQANISFIGWAAEQGRYDFALIYSNHFIGKTLVVCMQTGRSTLLSEEDLTPEQIQVSFQLEDMTCAKEAVQILSTRIPALQVRDQY
ncbi:SAV0927 family protein [Paenibacillus taiwanensis]|uniref:SAV0927 family protein n=1 Tax=Paenibacillus taiwanensis TaxID=401638 RepID=UPI00040ED992|nr:SAV0927 family protein [Paenibacillus taiwanensis]